MRPPKKKLSPADVSGLVDDMAETLGGGEVIKQDIRYVIENLPNKGPTWGRRTENIKHMKILKARATKVLATLRAEPDPHYSTAMLFAPEEGETTDAMMQEGERKKAALITELERLRARCDENIAANQPGVHGNVDYRERNAAVEARVLWELAGKRPTLTDSSIGSFIGFAEQLFHAVWREKPRDMRRACRYALQAPIKAAWFI
jgi:hypothetical protein